MPAREVLRRVLLWGIVAVFFATSITLAVLGEWTSLVGFSAFPVVGAIILTSRPGNGVGWYLLGVGIACIAVMWAGLSPDLMVLFPAWAESAFGGLTLAFWGSVFLIGVIYPTGRPETRLGRVVLWASAAVAVWGLLAVAVDPRPMFVTGRPNPFAVKGAELFVGFSSFAWQITTIGVVVAVVVDLVLRWRRASLIARLQYRWFVVAIVGTLSVSVISGVITAVAPGPLATAVNDFIAVGTLTLIPVSIGIAVTRHGLFEINRIVSRTVAYTTVTALAIGVYALVVTSITWLAPQLPSVGVAVATLAAATVFLPALRWVQRAIDRRFDRERYDAERVVDAFGERLRTQVDPAATTAQLIVAVDRTLQPASVGLWTEPR